MNRKQQSTILGLSLAAGLLAGTGREARAGQIGPTCGHLATAWACFYEGDSPQCENISSHWNYCDNVILDACGSSYVAVAFQCWDANWAELLGDCQTWRGLDELTGGLECTMDYR